MINKDLPELSYVVPLFFNQKNNNTLNRLLQRYSTYSQKTLDKIHFIFVDDCSPVAITLPAYKHMNISLLRITSDIQWNQGGARNLGVNYSKTTKLLLTDVDHVFPERTLAHLVKRKYDYNDFIRFRKFKGLKKISAGFNIFYINKPVFDDLNGYDELFSGHYGYEDVHLVDSLKKINIFPRKLSYWYPAFDLDIDRGTEYHSLVRDTKRNLDLLNQKESGEIAWHSGRRLNFDWHVVAETRKIW